MNDPGAQGRWLRARALEPLLSPIFIISMDVGIRLGDEGRGSLLLR